MKVFVCFVTVLTLANAGLIGDGVSSSNAYSDAFGGVGVGGSYVGRYGGAFASSGAAVNVFSKAGVHTPHDVHDGAVGGGIDGSYIGGYSNGFSHAAPVKNIQVISPRVNDISIPRGYVGGLTGSYASGFTSDYATAAFVKIINVKAKVDVGVTGDYGSFDGSGFSSFPDVKIIK
ncbi:uncharacterized protein LOC133330335, partial [Musca vetustissima]|uniref:uncharacterized protein LOC133330335 n=1 Tax=Musca vetustissima TaxID=27455 RepID=UPI002AB71C30